MSLADSQNIWDDIKILNNFFNLSSDLFCIAGIDGYFKKINPSFTKLLGYSQDELLSRPIQDFLHPDDVRSKAEQQKFVDNHMKAHHFENRYRTKQGNYVWLSWTSNEATQELFYAVGKDISDQKRSELRIRQSEQRFRSLVQNGYEIITIIDDQGRYSYHSESVFRILGYSPADLIGKSATELIHPGDREKVINGMKRAQGERYINNGIPYRIKAADGTWRWLESTASNMIDDPAIRGIVVNSRDV